ncbi:DinB family protein [Streptomyces sp. NBC_00237]|uniref:DinB family protein n=1 Tax=Streptomyces sp. NBC_00237 TaxID=2975687 RepID=UPI00225A6536|nr:DinB family protein [Streptomyces sp. NBC_00237]MCX5206605.1 DinB family protein [Streptomyces sp. NBC_00237]
MNTMPDGRPVPPPHADERTMLESWLDFHRATLALKCRGLDDEQIRTASVPPSPMTLLGLVRHLEGVERHWFQEVFAGEDVDLLDLMRRDGGFGLEDGPETEADAGGIAEALDTWRETVDRNRALVVEASLDAPGRLTGPEAAMAGSDTVSLRWILVHMIEEYARHNGHADLIRERIDGVTGP